MRNDIPVLCGCVVAKISMDAANFVRVLSIYRLLQITPEMNPRTTTLLLAKLELMQIQSSNLAFLSSSFFVSQKKIYIRSFQTVEEKEYIFGFTIVIQSCFLNRTHYFPHLLYMRYVFFKQWLQISTLPLF